MKTLAVGDMPYKTLLDKSMLIFSFDCKIIHNKEVKMITKVTQSKLEYIHMRT